MGSSPSRFLLLSFLSRGLTGSALPEAGNAVEAAANPPPVYIREEVGSREGAECLHVRV